jgi:hypothetical protein
MRQFGWPSPLGWAANGCGECKDGRCGDTSGSGDDTAGLQKRVLDR